MTEVKSIIVEAVGICANASPANPHGKALSGVIEAAMVAAVLECSGEGITDPAIIRDRMQSARNRAKAAFYQAAMSPTGETNGNDQ